MTAFLLVLSPTHADGPKIIAQFPHAGRVTSAAIAPDRSYVLTGGEDETVILWNTSTGRQVRHFTISDGAIQDIDISADSRHALTVQGGRALVWNVRTGALEHQLFGKKRQTFVDRLFFGETHRGTDRNPFRDPIEAAKFLGDSMDIVSASPLMLWRGSNRTPDLISTFSASALDVSASGRFLAAKQKLYGVAIFDLQTLERLATARPKSIEDLALSDDGSTLVTASSEGIDVYDAATGALKHRIPDIEATEIAMSGDGRYLALGDFWGNARVLDLEGNDRPVALPTQKVSELAVSDDGQTLLTVGPKEMVLWDIVSRRDLKHFEWSERQFVDQIANSSDGRFLAVADSGEGIWLWDLAGLLAPHYVPLSGNLYLMEFVGQPAKLAAVQDDTVTLIDPQYFRPPKTVVFREQSESMKTMFGELAALSSDGRYAARGHLFGYGIAILDMQTGRRISTLVGHTDEPKLMTFSADGKLLATAARDGTVRLWRVEDGQLLQTAALDEPVWFDALAFGDAGTVVFIDGNGGDVYSLGVDGSLERILEKGATVLSESGNRAATNKPVVYDLKSSRRLLKKKLDYYYTESLLSPNGRWLYTRHGGGATLWDVDNRVKLWEYLTPGDARPMFLRGSNEDKFAVMITDGGIELLDFHTGRSLARLIGQPQGAWLIVTADGQFDTNNIDESKAVNWVLPADPMTSLPLAVFMREYFQPNLLTRLINGEPAPPAKDLGGLNITQPAVTITRVIPEPCTPAPCSSDTVSIEVQARSIRSPSQQTESGVVDLRLFRDGQLVGYKDGALSTESVRFSGIRLPRRQDQQQTTFTAYAFNSDGIKSETARFVYDLPPGLEYRRGVAYVVAAGVNSFENSDWDLTFAADDAREMGRVLEETLQRREEFRDVVSITLLSDLGHGEGTATKDNFRKVLAILAGQTPGSAGIPQVDNSERLAAARPEDLVFVVFSSHGYADEAGRFYLLPSDIGPGQGKNVSASLLARAISSDDLAHWMRDIDAGELVLIVDACHSAASVEGSGFKPGPMGSRGLGQLAYDKGMRVLAATQADRPAYETSSVRHGLLTYTLLERGLISQEADFRPRNGSLLLSEWLAYAPARMGGVYDELESRAAEKGIRPASFLPEGDLYASRLAHLQQPRLFDYARRSSIELTSQTQ